MQILDRSSWSRGLQKAWLTRGPVALALLPLSALFALLSVARAWFYRRGWLATIKLQVPVVVVGNLVVGGAGKTPTVIAVVELLRRHGFTPGIVARGYGGSNAGLLEVNADTPASECGDEPKLLRLRTQAPVMVGRDRVAAGRELLRRHSQLNVLVSDDGLQHLRLARDAQVIVFDERGVGNGLLLPAGPLREAPGRLPPARSIVLYNAAKATMHWPGILTQRSLAGAAPLRAWWSGEPATLANLEALRGRDCLAAAGIASPDRFFALLRQSGVSCRTLPLPDHHAFKSLPWQANEGDVVITEKDAVKIAPGRCGNTRVWVAALDLRTGPQFESALLGLLPPVPASGGPHGSASA